MNQKDTAGRFQSASLRFYRRWLAVAGLLLAVTPLSAVVLYWDTNSTTAGAGSTPTGTWSTSGAANRKWSTSAGGTTSTAVWTSGSDAVFSAGTDAINAYTVTVSGTQNVSSITVQEGTPTFTSGTINFNDATPDLIVNTGRTLNFNSAITSSTGNLNISGGGTVSLGSNLTLANTLTLGGGTLSLANTSYTFGTLNVTANSVIDFAGATTLNLSNLVIAAGVTLTVTNWTEAADFFYTAAWSGAVRDTGGSSPMNQVVFSGFTASDTQWASLDNQVKPVVPEPATYGALLLGASSLLLLWSRRARATTP